MKRSSLKRPLTILLAVLLLGGLSCTTLDNPIELVGSIKLHPTAGGDDRIANFFFINENNSTVFTQYAIWYVSDAVLTLDDREVDLLSGEDQCTWWDELGGGPTVKHGFGDSPPPARCSSGVILGASEQLQQANLRVTLSMEMRRHVAFEKLFAGDNDGDGILNDGDNNEITSSDYCPDDETNENTNCDDNCPLISNPDQADSFPEETEPADKNGIGDACEIEVWDTTTDPPTVSYLRDEDGDGYADALDTCIWTVNPSQFNAVDITASDGSTGSDQIGEACQETVVVNGGNSFTIEGSVEPFDIPEAQTIYLVVDLRDGLAVDCDWDLGTCTVEPDAVDLCVRESFSEATEGCTTAR